MHIWYKAVCKKCGEGRDIFVNTPSRTATFLSRQDEEIWDFLLRHFNCEIVMMHSDLEFDKLWADGWIFDGPDGDKTSVIRKPKSE